MTPIIITSNGERFCLVAVPSHSESFSLDVNKIWYDYPSVGQLQREYQMLPTGRWSILGTGTADQLSEEQMRQVVEMVFHTPVLFADYIRPAGITFAPLLNVAESFSSLLHSHNLSPSTTVILKEETA